jgi:long-chain acyl-CoA synthetase
MTKSAIVILVLAVVTGIAGGSRAAEVSGVHFDDQIDVGGVPLVLNGAGLRTKLMLKIYVIGLYLPSRTTSADSVIGGKQLRHVRLVMKRALGAGTIWDAFDEGIQANSSAAELAALKPKLDEVEKLFKAFGDVAEGAAIDIDFTVEGTTNVTYQGKPQGSIAGPDLQRALLKIWLGPKPIQEDVKQALLAGK